MSNSCRKKKTNFFKHKSLVRFFLLSTLFSFVIFFIITGFSLGIYQFSSISKLKNNFKENQLKSINANLNQYIENRIQVLNDIAGLPFIKDSVISLNTNNPDLDNFMKVARVFGNLGSKTLLDLNKNIIFTNSKLSFDDAISLKNLDSILNKDEAVQVIFNNKEQIEFIVPVLYKSSVRGIFIYSEDFDLDSVTGDVRDLAISLESRNQIKLESENFDLHKEGAISTSLSRYGIDLTIAPDVNLERNITVGAFYSILLSLFVGALVSAVVVFIFGKDYLIEPYEKLEESKI